MSKPKLEFYHIFMLIMFLYISYKMVGVITVWQLLDKYAVSLGEISDETKNKLKEIKDRLPIEFEKGYAEGFARGVRTGLEIHP